LSDQLAVTIQTGDTAVVVQPPADPTLIVQPQGPDPTLVITSSGPPGPAGENAAQEIIAARDGNPPNGATLFWYEFGAAGGALDLANCRMRVGVAPIADYVCPIASNGAALGTWVVPAGATDGVLTLSQVDYAPNVDLKVTSPLTPDANLSSTLIIMALEG
jgi:hypothetical protein